MTNTISKVIHNGTEYEFKDTTYTQGTGITINGTTISNAGVTSVNSNTGAVNLKTVKSTSLIGTGDISINEVPGTGTTGYVLTKNSSGYGWAAPSGGDVKVSSQSGNILTSGMKIWAGTEADYGNLGTYDNNTVYLTI